MKKYHYLLVGLAVIVSALAINFTGGTTKANGVVSPRQSIPVSSERYRVTEDCILRKPFALEVGDEIITVNGAPFTGIYEDFGFICDEFEAKNKLVIEFNRNGEKHTVSRTRKELEELDSSFVRSKKQSLLEAQATHQT